MKYQARQKGYKVLGEYTPDEVLPFTGQNAPNKLYCSHMVKMTSLRYQTFKQSLMCKCCGLYGTTMLLELPHNGGKVCTPHFNMYAEREGELVQMTKDHITPKSRGGKDHLNNMQTMCCRCNELKGNQGGKLKRLREIQDGVQTVYIVPSMDGFATSDKGIAEIVRKHVVAMYRWEADSFEVQVSIRLKTVKVVTKIGEPVVFALRPIRRI